MSYLIASAISLLAFLPWMGILLVNRRAAAGSINWAGLETTRLSLVKNSLGNIGRVLSIWG
ncbi:hypothetical protein [Microcoleus asticus]|uniref:hypothetical protein n=1 Tax=Microcoleus asticus TaxID=2815231 RepID=UPI001554720A|nr:hypothetical protein [Microcoleus asticus]